MSECKCINTEVRRREIRGGYQHVRQCLDCGERVGNPLKQDGEVPPFDEDLVTALRLQSVADRELKRERDKAEFDAQYAAYLASDEWKALRGRVLQRDASLCQGCLTAPAEVVHHITYDNVFAEFAFQLVSLCNECHARIHAGDQEA